MFKIVLEKQIQVICFSKSICKKLLGFTEYMMSDDAAEGRYDSLFTLGFNVEITPHG